MSDREKLPPRRTRQKRPAENPQAGHWILQDAQGRFGELVHRVRTEGPQHVIVSEREEVVVIAVEEFRRLKGEPTGEVLIAAMQATPHRELNVEPARAAMPVRQVCL